MRDTNNVENIKLLHKLIETARHLDENAKERLAQLTARSPVKVTVGNFYRTLDNSTVFVLARQTGQGGGGIFGLLFNPQPGPAPEHTEHSEEDESTARYLVVVLRGGHGLAKVTGEKPGEQYLVDAEGSADLQLLNDDAKSSLEGYATAILGLSLQMELRFKAVPADEV